jgi:thioredoxin 1
MNTPAKALVVAALAAAVAATLVLKEKGSGNAPSPSAAPGLASTAPQAAGQKLPKLLDLGAGKCIPCKAMAPILEDLKQEYAGRMEVEFIDVWLNPEVSKQHGIEIIPTQIFYSAEGKELFRHVGFYGKQDILSKWKDLGIDLGETWSPIVREQAVQPDTRPSEQVCFMCDGDVSASSRTVVRGEKEQRILCSPHCYFIYFSSIVGADPDAEAAKVQVTDQPTAAAIPAAGATFLYGLDSEGRPTIGAFRDRDEAARRQRETGGNLVDWAGLRAKELATRCAFCDRAVYPEDACAVKIGSIRGYGCCTHCAMGVAARLKQDIEVQARDGLTGERIVAATMDGQISMLEPATATAWFGQKKDAAGTWVSAGCFKQGFFGSSANLQKWLEERPAMTGREITIAQALADKMKLSPEQIAKACKLGECQ